MATAVRFDTPGAPDVLTLEETASLAPGPNEVWLEQAARERKGGYTRIPVCGDGSWEGDWYGVQPKEGDLVVSKHRYDAFQGTELDLVLHVLDVEGPSSGLPTQQRADALAAALPDPVGRVLVVQAVDAYTHCHSIRPWYVTREKEPCAFWVKT